MATLDSREEAKSSDNWDLWSEVYSDRDMRMKLYCRDPEERTPCTSNTLVVRNINLECPPRTVVELFAKFGRVESSEFPTVMSDCQSRYCFIKFQDCRDAVRACNYYNGFKLHEGVLEVVHYDSAHKFCKLVERNKNIQLKIEAEENIVGYVRQAHLQAEFRAKKRSKQNAQQTVSVDNEATWLYSDSEVTNNLEDFLEEENRMQKHLSVDDVGLESEASFWYWLRGKLNFTGPLHYTHPDIAKALHKLPYTVRRQFDWLLGSLRVADQFCMVGPFVCLREHTYWAKEMCFVARLDYKAQFKEIWEPCCPSDIKNDRQLIKYVRAMLMTFGPLSTTDSKILLMLRCLVEPMRGNPSYSPDGLCRILEDSPLFIVNKDIYYLVREHEHFLGRAKVEDWRMDETSSMTTTTAMTISEDNGSCGKAWTHDSYWKLQSNSD